MLKWFVEIAPIRSKMMIVAATLVGCTIGAGAFGIYQIQHLAEALVQAKVPGAEALIGAVTTNAYIAILIGGAVSLALGLWFRSAICNSYVQTVVRMESLAAGDTTTPITRTSFKDCVGRMSRAMETFRQNIIDKENLQKQR
jgi:methyl-accepting chemotaxis protein